VSVDERSRLQLAEAAKRLLGDDEGITLMELLPPVGWADVATKHDLLALETRVEARFDEIDRRFGENESRFDAKLEAVEHRLTANFERALRSVEVRLMSLLVTAFLAVIAANVVTIALR
jgi:hypothetical protein